LPQIHPHIPFGEAFVVSRDRTTTSSFGAPGRENHDASPFYNGRIYSGQPLEQLSRQEENPLPEGARDCIYAHSSESMHELPDNSIHLMVTSPPYNVGKDYDQDLDLDEFRSFLSNVWREVFRVLVPGGRACINIANLGRKPYLPIHAFLIEDMLSIGYLMRGEVIWDKAASAGSSTAWGSWLSPSNPALRDVHEYILIFSKHTYRRRPTDDRSATIQKDQFLQNTKSVWTFPSVSAKKIGHPAPFPLELPSRLIQLYTYAGDIVLDPFMGSGQTAIAAVQAGRSYVGYELSKEYARHARKRIAAT
jgi:DNA modification methylase